MADNTGKTWMSIGETDDSNAIIETFVANAAITKGDPVYLSADDKVSPATTAQDCIGIALKSVAQGDPCPVLIHGRVKVKVGGAVTREFLEDATWNVMESMTEKVGRALGEAETNKILELYGAIANADLAGGAPIDNDGNAINWSGVLKLHNAVRGENWRPTVLAVNEIQLHQLLSDDKFIHAQYLPSEQVDLERGVIGSILGMKVLASTLVPNGTAYAIDTRVAAVMLLRRDITVEDWEDPKSGKFGVRATTRFGLGVLRSKAVAKMVNISTSL